MVQGTFQDANLLGPEKFCEYDAIFIFFAIFPLKMLNPRVFTMSGVYKIIKPISCSNIVISRYPFTQNDHNYNIFIMMYLKRL